MELLQHFFTLKVSKIIKTFFGKAYQLFSELLLHPKSTSSEKTTLQGDIALKVTKPTGS
jgi:hypothetical protein